MNPVSFERSLRESKNTGWLEEYSQMMMNANTAKDGGNIGGRPQLDDGDLSDSGQMNRDQ